MSKQPFSRRDFFKSAGMASLAPAVLTLIKPESVRGTAANSAISVGVIGPGRRGTFDAAIMAKHPDARIVSLADIFDDQIEAARKLIPVESPRVYKDYQALLSSDVDAVLIATPPYLHPEHFEAAVSAGKHIFLEKPVAVDSAGCRRVAAAGRRANPAKDIVIGFQQRYGPGYREAYRRVREGAIGPVKMVRASWLGGDLPRRKGNWPPEEEKIRNWLFYRDRSGDFIVEQDCHNLDVVNWFLGAHPLRAVGRGGRLVRTDIGDIMDNLSLTYEYPGGVLLSYAANQFSKNRFGHVGEEFIGTAGAIETSRPKVTHYQPDNVLWTMEARQDITIDAVHEFFARIRQGKVENLAAAAADSTLTAILGRTAIYEGREMNWEQVAGA